MKKLDIYILRKFLGTFVYSISLISIIIIVFDVAEKLDDFLTRHAPFKAIAVDYYLNFVPFLVNQFSPLFIFISVVFFTSRMAARSEIVAILGSGVSFRRFIYPYMLGSFFIAALSLYLNFVTIPNANKTRLRFENRYVHGKIYNNNINIHRQISPGVFIYVESYNTENNSGEKFALEQMNGQKLKFKLMADYIGWDTNKKKWTLYNYFSRSIADDGSEKLSYGSTKDTIINLKPYDFVEQVNDVEAMNYKELDKYIEQQKMIGSTNILFFEEEKYKRIAFPFAAFVLTLIGVSLSSRKVRGGTGLHLGLGLLVAFSFILFMRVSTTFAEGGLISPQIAVWIPNFIYGVLALFMVRVAPK
jgi:lipopolysaccharide export system permease protein